MQVDVVTSHLRCGAASELLRRSLDTSSAGALDAVNPVNSGTPHMHVFTVSRSARAVRIPTHSTGQSEGSISSFFFSLDSPSP